MWKQPRRHERGPPPPATKIASLQQQFVSVIKRVSPSVVQIRTEQALGSGVVFDNDESSRERRS
jgi:S1-C subfamily serine protease